MGQPVGHLAELRVGDAAGRPPPRPPRGPRARPGVRSAQRSTQLWARFTVPPVNHVAQAGPSRGRRPARTGVKNSRSRSLHHRVPEPGDVFGGPADEVVVRIDPVRPHEPRDVGPFHVIFRRTPHEIRGHRSSPSGPVEYPVKPNGGCAGPANHTRGSPAAEATQVRPPKRSQGVPGAGRRAVVADRGRVGLLRPGDPRHQRRYPATPCPAAGTIVQPDVLPAHSFNHGMSQRRPATTWCSGATAGPG